jgi:hypothetical protein
METENVTKAAMFMCIFLSCICIPVLAYSGDAIGWFEQGNALIKTKNYSEAILKLGMQKLMHSTGPSNSPKHLQHPTG